MHQHITQSGRHSGRKGPVFVKHHLEAEIKVQQKSEQLDVARGTPPIHTRMRCDAVTLFTYHSPTHASTRSSSEFAPAVPSSLSSSEICYLPGRLFFPASDLFSRVNSKGVLSPPPPLLRVTQGLISWLVFKNGLKYTFPRSSRPQRPRCMNRDVRSRISHDGANIDLNGTQPHLPFCRPPYPHHSQAGPLQAHAPEPQGPSRLKHRRPKDHREEGERG